MPLFSRRIRKKAFYAGGLFVVIVAIIVGLVALSGGGIQRTAKVTPEPTIMYQPIKKEKVVVLPHRRSNGVTDVDVVVQLRNPNPRAGISNYPVTMNINAADGRELLTHTEETHMLPGSLQYVMAVGLQLPPLETLGQVDVTLPENPNFQVLADTVQVPTFNTFLRDRTDQPVGDETLETQTGLVKNTSTFDWQKVEVNVVALNKNREIIAAGKTFLGALLANEQREFTVQWTKPDEPIAQVLALPTTDIFSEANYLQTVGNPGSLR